MLVLQVYKLTIDLDHFGHNMSNSWLLLFFYKLQILFNWKCRETISQTGRVDNSREIILIKT